MVAGEVASMPGTLNILTFVTDSAYRQSYIYWHIAYWSYRQGCYCLFMWTLP